METTKVLTYAMREVLEFIAGYEVSGGYSPSIREILQGTSVTSTSVVNYYIDALQKRGYLERDRKVARGIRMNPSGYEEAGYKPKYISHTCPHCHEITRIKVEGQYEKEFPSKVALLPVAVKSRKINVPQPVAA